MSKRFKYKDNNYLDSTGIVHNKEILKNYLENVPTYGEDNIWKYWKFSNKFFVAIIPQTSLTFTDGERRIELPFKVVTAKTTTIAMARWNNTVTFMHGGLVDENIVLLGMGNQFTGDNMTNVLVIGEYI